MAAARRQAHQDTRVGRPGASEASVEHQAEKALVVPETTTKAEARPRWVTGIAGEGRGGHRLVTSGHDLEGNPGRGQGQGFLAATAEHEGVAPLRRTTRLPAAGGRGS